MGIPISQLPELTSADEGDLIPIVDVSGNVTKRLPAEGVRGLTNPKKTNANGWTTYDHGSYKEHICWVNIPASNTTLSYVSSPTIPDGKVRNNFFATISSGVDSRVVLGLSNPDSTLTSYSISFVTFTGTAVAFPATLRIVEK